MKEDRSGWIYRAAPLAGVLLCLYYVGTATCDVVYDDYIRLVNSYLPEVWDFRKFLVPDVLTRIPANYLGRILNVTFFGYSTMFDMVLGVLGLGWSGFLLAGYCKRRRVGLPAFLAAMVVVFSLNKWEMLTNGSGWSHFLAFAMFYYHYLVLDRVAAGEERRGDRARLIWLPFLITLGMAGPYCAVYSATLLLSYGFAMWRSRRESGKWDHRYLAYGICVLVPLILYLWSNSYAVYEHSGATDQPFLATLLDVPSFFARFFVKSFSSMVMGGEVLQSLFPSSSSPLFLLGFLVMAAYGWALWLNVSRRIYEKTMFPLMCLAAGGMNHVLILLSRWIFLNEDYGMSSRYALQFQIGILGILLTFGLVAAPAMRKVGGRLGGYGGRPLALLFGLLVLAGNLYTCREEFLKAPYRRVYYERRVEAAMEFESLDDDTLRDVFDYRKKDEGSGQKVRQALATLKAQGWNVYRD